MIPVEVKAQECHYRAFQSHVEALNQAATIDGRVAPSTGDGENSLFYSCASLIQVPLHSWRP
jgi:hypothetical protein